KIEHHRGEGRVALARGDRQMSGRAAQIDQPPKAAEVEGRYDVRRADEAKAVHAHQKLALRLLGAEKVREDRAFPAIHLLPAVRSFADGVFETLPELPHHRIAVVEVAGQPAGTV